MNGLASCRLNQPTRIETFVRFSVGALAALTVATSALWLPAGDSATTAFPDLSMHRSLSALAAWVDMMIVPVLAISGLGIFVWPGDRGRIAWLVAAGMLTLGFATDQHRLQPWAYQTWLYAIVFAIVPMARRPLDAIRVLAVSVYFFSALGKLDAQFLHTVGHDFLEVATGWVGIDSASWDEATRTMAAALFPIGEMIVAGLLTFRVTRRIGGFLAIAMHAVLVACLSPMGMNHSVGVLVWNVVLAIQAWLLFCKPPGASEESPAKSTMPMAAWLLVAAAVLLPLTDRRGWWDHWMSWALYSPYTSRVDVEIHDSELVSLPVAIQASIEPDADGDHWHRLNLTDLALNVRGVPLNPQSRVQVALVLKLSERLMDEGSIRGILAGPADRWSGQREETWWLGRRELVELADGFVLTSK